MKKIGFSLLFSILVMGLFATVTFANPQDLPNNNELQNYELIDLVDEFDRVNENANDTGSGVTEQDNFDEVIKAVDGHTTHGDYQHNTNSCASCHQTHTAAAGSRLTFADNNFKTCVACHDGTLGFYNVFETGENASMNGAGTFGGSHANNMSVHMANGSLKINAAPGGSRAASGVWNQSFNCASCHAPHGSYSDRLLHNNPNGFATNPQVTQTNAQGQVVNRFGNYLQNLPVVNAKQAGMHLLRITTEDYVKIELHNGTGSNSKVNTPWLYGYSGHGTPHFTRLYEETAPGTGTEQSGNGGNGTTRVWYGNDDVYVSFAKGYFKAENQTGKDLLNKMTHGHISRPYIVKFDLVEVDDIDGLKIYETNQESFYVGANIPEERRAAFRAAGFNTNLDTGWTTNMGVAMSTYCATCHTDYFTSRTNSGGTYFGANGTAAQRHSTNSDRFSCVRCHYAHGTDAEIMWDAMGNTVASLQDDGMDFEDALAQIVDVNPSSALKKYTNMTSCWACHSNSSRATSFINTDKRDAADLQKEAWGNNPGAMPVVGGQQR